MPVAKSYANMPILCEPYIVSGRQYVKVDTGKGEKQVRWYSDAEYRRMYPSAPAAGSKSKAAMNQKEALGFAKGYITIFKGDTYSQLDWFRASVARYCRWWGWYIVSTEEVPDDIPEGITPIILNWDSVGDEDGNLKSDEAIKEVVESLIYDESPSQFVGAIGERIEAAVKITKVIEVNGNYGSSNMHIFEDKDGNVYVWTTASKRWLEGSEKVIRGTVKDHRTYKGVHQTILNRCMERK